jgi:TolB-like protein/DNA-binding winged helix-turn-helix (wHTH) protein/Tfp pilus assembly protein PilF
MDVRARELRKEGGKVRLAHQPFGVLELLLERSGDVVTREDLRRRLWSADTFVDFDLSLNSAVRKLRDALGDSADRPTFIETLPRVGYRFIASLERPPISAGAAKGAVSSLPPPPLLRRPRLQWAVALSALALIALAVLGWRWGPGKAQVPLIRSIAVLPLENLTGDPTRDYIADGLTDALITELAHVSSASIISRMSSMQYKEVKKRLPDVARELNVDAIVEGAVSLSGSHVYLTAQLIHAATDRHLWARSYESEMKDVFRLQADVARAIAGALANGRVSAAPVPASRSEVLNPDAIDLYFKGSLERGRATYDGNLAALSYFEKAVAIQQDFARAHASIALTWVQLLMGGPKSPGEVLPKAEEAARKALELDDSLEEAYRALAFTRHTYRDFAGFKEATDRLQELAPRDAASLNRLALWHLSQLRFDAAVEAAERAHDADPLFVNATLELARAHRAAGHHERAIAELQGILQTHPNQRNVRFRLGATYVLKGDTKAGIAELEKLLGPLNPRFASYLAYAYALDGNRRESRKLLQRLVELGERQYVSSFGIALVYDALGEKTAARKALERAWQEYAYEFTQLDYYPEFETLVADPRYQQLFGH